MTTTHQDLRDWARGIYPLEAGVELVVRSCGGRFASPGNPWICKSSASQWYVDVDELTEDELAPLSGGETALLRVAAALLGGTPVDLNDTLPRLDRASLELTLAAVAHASGSHEHSGLVTNADGRPSHFTRLTSLYPWP